MLPEFREWVVEFGQRAYVALYHFDGEQVVILAVRHGREAGYKAWLELAWVGVVPPIPSRMGGAHG